MEPVIEGLSLAFGLENILLVFVGVLIGVVVGALPGLSSPLAIALLLPFTVTLEPVSAICMMAALYCAGTFGGSITAILINAPGAPPAVATAFDGYPMAKRGEAGREGLQEEGGAKIRLRTRSRRGSATLVALDHLLRSGDGHLPPYPQLALSLVPRTSDLHGEGRAHSTLH